jgi:hypothetical protein
VGEDRISAAADLHGAVPVGELLDERRKHLREA